MKKTKFNQPKVWLLFGGLIIGLLITSAVITQPTLVGELKLEGSEPAGRFFSLEFLENPGELEAGKWYCLCHCRNAYNSKYFRPPWYIVTRLQCSQYGHQSPDPCIRQFGPSYSMVVCTWKLAGGGPVYVPP